ncbi:hypothetical protein HPP92_022308 [Vanilla planifolia]|uniref:Uncharacterized protein n=1 Tax=Vanilla planifolia TaxID=51239 RepID=A0A835PV44_VANPL|nr:hypothetical protein HPP92_022308 [Vanilla planifolia]
MVADAWSREEEKAFENALAVHFDTCGDWLEKVAAAVPGKAMREIKNHYKILVEDVSSIELGKVPLPDYAPSSFDGLVDESFADKKGGVFHDSGHGGRGSKSDHERRKELLGLRRNTGCSFSVWISMAKAIGEAYQGTSSSPEHQPRWPVMPRSTSYA